MKSLLVALGLIVFLGWSRPQSETKQIGHMHPLPSELLPESIQTQGCPGFSIIEWRASPGEENTTGFTSETLKVIDTTCAKALEKFPSFLKQEGIILRPGAPEPTGISVAIMPFDIQKDGTEYRNLNDIDFRFVERSKTYDSQGNVYSILGYTQHSRKTIYLRNDILLKDKPNKKFQGTLAHEIFHALSLHYGIFDSHSGNKEEADEKLAVKFVAYLGYPRKLY